MQQEECSRGLASLHLHDHGGNDSSCQFAVPNGQHAGVLLLLWPRELVGEALAKLPREPSERLAAQPQCVPLSCAILASSRPAVCLESRQVSHGQPRVVAAEWDVNPPGAPYLWIVHPLVVPNPRLKTMPAYGRAQACPEGNRALRGKNPTDSDFPNSSLGLVR